jgi:hypothetical protein
MGGPRQQRVVIDERRVVLVPVKPLAGADGNGDLQFGASPRAAESDALDGELVLAVEHLAVKAPVGVEVEAVLALDGERCVELGDGQLLRLQVGVVGVSDGLPRAEIGLVDN